MATITNYQTPGSAEDYDYLVDGFNTLAPAERNALYRDYALSDLYFLLRFVLRREDLWNPPPPVDGRGEPLELDEEGATRTLRWRSWCFSRCREVQANPNGYLDLWARAHYKSTILTFALTIQEILKNPEIRVAVFSQDNKIAASHLAQIKREFEGNEFLKELFPEVLWKRPEVEAPLWSQEKGIIVKRKGNPKEPTLSSYGLVDGLPVGPHFDLLVYDDTVTKESVRSPLQIRKTTEAWEHSLGLRAAGARVRYIGTRYHLSDTYEEILRRGAALPRIHPAEREGEPALFSRAELLEIRKNMGSATFASQMTQDPRADSALGFKREWLEKCRYDKRPEDVREGLHVYLLCDPATGKKKTSDYTALLAVGLGKDKNYYVLDMARDRLLLQERAAILFALHEKWAPVAAVGYEEYGAQADTAHFQEKMGRDNYRFPITRLAGTLSKEDRIRRLSPLFEQGRILFPPSLLRTDSEGKPRDLVRDFIEEEYCAFPVGAHDDLLDALSRILDTELFAAFPLTEEEKRRRRNHPPRKPLTWMGA